MNAPVNVQVKRVNSFSAKILRDGKVEDFQAKFFTLKPTDYPGVEGETWTFTAEQTVKVGGNQAINRTITIIVPRNVKDGNFSLPQNSNELHIDYVDSDDDSPYIHKAEKGTAILKFERKGEELSTISGNLDITVSGAESISFKISGVFYYAK